METLDGADGTANKVQRAACFLSPWKELGRSHDLYRIRPALPQKCNQITTAFNVTTKESDSSVYTQMKGHVSDQRQTPRRTPLLWVKGRLAFRR